MVESNKVLTLISVLDVNNTTPDLQYNLVLVFKAKNVVNC